MAIIPLQTTADIRGAERLNKELSKTDKELEEITKRARGAAGAAERLAKQADPQKRYNDQMARLAVAVKKGGLEIDHARTLATKYTNQLNYTGQAGKAAFSDQILSKVGGMATGLLSASTAAAAVRNELVLLREEADKIANTQISAAGAREKLLQNIAQLPDAQRTSFIAKGEQLAAKLGQPQAVIDAALADAYSGSGGNVDAAFRNVRLAARYNPNTPDAIAGTAGALSDVSKATLDQNALRNLGFLNKIGAASRVVDPTKQFKSIPQALAGMVTAEATAEQSGALFAALSNAITDTEGNVTTTSAINFGAKLETFVNSQIEAGKVAKDVDTFAERLGVVQGDKTLGQAFVNMMGGEAKSKGLLEQFVMDPNSAIARQYKEVQAGFGTAADQVAHGKRTIAIINADRYGKTASANRIVNSLGEQFELGASGYLTEKSKAELDTAFLAAGRATSGDFDYLHGTIQGNRYRRYARTGSQVSIPEAQQAVEAEAARLNSYLRQHGPGGSDLQAGKEQLRDVNTALEKLERAADAFERLERAAPAAVSGGRRE